jgi:hypothetical protein
MKNIEPNLKQNNFSVESLLKKMEKKDTLSATVEKLEIVFNEISKKEPDNMKKINKILKNVISAGLKKHGINFE